MRTIVAVAMLAGQAGAVDTPLRPVSAWNVEYAQDMCIVSRNYGDAAAPLTIGFRPTPFGDIVQAIVVGPPARLGRQGEVDVELSTPACNVTEKDRGTRVRFPDGKRAVLTYYVPRAALDGLVGAPAVTIRASGSAPITAALSLGATVLATLRTCEADLLQHWGYDPAKIAAVVTRASGRPGDNGRAQWITADDYPAAALNARQQGRTLIGWTISTDGRVTDCKVLRSSGVADLDTAACGAITRRGRYQPARDAAGNAVESYSTRYVVWQLPS